MVVLDNTSPKILIPAALFTALSPGMILQLPDTNNLATRRTSRESIFFHSLVFVVVYSLVARVMGISL